MEPRLVEELLFESRLGELLELNLGKSLTLDLLETLRFQYPIYLGLLTDEKGLKVLKNENLGNGFIYMPDDTKLEITKSHSYKIDNVNMSLTVGSTTIFPRIKYELLQSCTYSHENMLHDEYSSHIRHMPNLLPLNKFVLLTPELSKSLAESNTVTRLMFELLTYLVVGYSAYSPKWKRNYFFDISKLKEIENEIKNRAVQNPSEYI